MKSTQVIRSLTLFVGILIGCAARAPGQTESLLGTVDGNMYLHVSRAFRVKVTSSNITDSQAGVEFKHVFALSGSITGWESVSFLRPEVSGNKGLGKIIEAIITELGNEMYKGKNVKSSIVLTREDTVLGRNSLYARVSFPEYPGTGMTVFTQNGEQRDADFVGHFHIIPIGDLGLFQRGQRIDHLLVTSMQSATSLSGESSDLKHTEFVRGIELLSNNATSGQTARGTKGTIAKDAYTSPEGDYHVVMPNASVPGAAVRDEGGNEGWQVIFTDSSGGFYRLMSLKNGKGEFSADGVVRMYAQSFDKNVVETARGHETHFADIEKHGAEITIKIPRKLPDGSIQWDSMTPDLVTANAVFEANGHVYHVIAGVAQMEKMDQPTAVQMAKERLAKFLDGLQFGR